MQWFYFVASVFAVWRITHLISSEDGPFDIIFRIRKKIHNGFLSGLMDCFYCLSVWIALPFGCWMGTTWTERILIWWALSGAACLLEQATTKNNRDNGPEYKED